MLIANKKKITMFETLKKKLAFLYEPYVLGVLCVGYVLGELGHYLIGVTSKRTAIDLHYGDITCQLNSTDYHLSQLPILCTEANNSDTCLTFELNGTRYCEWNYNGLGLDYQIVAGPAFIAVFTVVGVAFGFAADKFNRVRMLTVCTMVFAVAIILCGTVQEYWQLVLLRMIQAAGESGCNPLATGILSDIFPESKRALVMSLFNWGIYGGYGLAFPVGRYIPPLNIWDMGWRITYYGSGVIALIVAIITGLTLREPARQQIGENAEGQQNGTTNPKKKVKVSIWKVICEPRIVMLCLAASIRHCGGMCFAYNCDLYYQQYFPDYDLGWWLFAVTIGIGSVGVVAGGIVSDKFVAKMGVRSRVAVLAISQLIATPGSFGSVYFNPVGAMITLGVSYFFAEMWFGILFAILVEIVPVQVRSTTVGIFLFVMNNIGGNLPILVEPVSKAIGYRESLYIFYAGFYFISSIMFLGTLFLMEGPKKVETPVDYGHDNNIFTTADERQLPSITSNGINGKHLPRLAIENSRL